MDQGDATTLEPDSIPPEGASRSVLTLWLVHHRDLSRVGERAVLSASSSSRLSRLVPRFAKGHERGTPLDDAHLSRRPVFLEPDGRGGARLLCDGGATRVHVDGERCDEAHALSPEALARGVVIELGGRVALVLRASPPTETMDARGFVGRSAALSRVLGQVARVGPSDIPVLLRGESGTGKELVAKALHEASERRDAPFVSVNMAAIPASTAAASLFGHARGAFTGAVGEALGYFRAADGGTLFLDEVGDTPPDLQASLFRALESGEVQPVGDDRTSQVDVRLVAATDVDLEAAVERGAFRQALVQRLGGYVVQLPPLRERPEDVGALLVHFLRAELERLGQAAKLATPEPPARPWLPTWLVAAASRAAWPGNVRQLRNVARQLAIDWSAHDTIGRTPEVEQLFEPSREGAPAPAPAPPAQQRPEALTEDDLVKALRAHDWQPAPAAVALGISRTTLYALMKKSDRIRKAADLSAATIHEALEASAGDEAQAAAALCVSARGLMQRMRKLGLD